MKEVESVSWNKKGISIMIGYILLITGAIVMSAIVYQGLKTWVPKESIDCPDGVSLFVLDSTCIKQQDGTYEMTLNLRNNGRFDIGGFFIHARNTEDKEQLATIDLSPNLSLGGDIIENSVVFYVKGQEKKNLFDTGEEREVLFSGLNMLYSIEILPFRFQVTDNKRQLVSCSKAKITETLECRALPVCGNNIVETGEQCDDGNKVSNDGCSSTCQEEATCTDTCTSLNYTCGTQSVCGIDIDCGTCAFGICNATATCELECTNSTDCDEISGEICSPTNVCTLCGNGVVDNGEECDDNNTNDGDGCSSICQRESGWFCSGSPSVCNYVG